jgi:hypothetical protein
MIPYADLERAIARWKARQAGHELSSPYHDAADAVVSSETAEHPVHEVGGSGLISIEDEPTRH